MTLLPRPVYPPNSPIAALQTAEMFLVATLRLWAAPHRNPTETHPHWHQGFEAAGLEDTGTSGVRRLLSHRGGGAPAARRPVCALRSSRRGRSLVSAAHRPVAT